MEDKWVQDILKELEMGTVDVKQLQKGEKKMKWFYVKSTYADKQFINLEQTAEIVIKKLEGDKFNVRFLSATGVGTVVDLTGGEVNALLIAIKN